MPQLTNGLYPTLKKSLDQTRTDANVFPGHRDRHLFRLADVYLMRAEANIRAGRPADAIADLNVIRRRAAVAGQNNDVNATATVQRQPDRLPARRAGARAGRRRASVLHAHASGFGRLPRVASRRSTRSSAGRAGVPHAAPDPAEPDRPDGRRKEAFPQNTGY